MAIGRGDIISFYFETTLAGAWITDYYASQIRSLMERSGFDQVSISRDGGWLTDSYTGQARVTSGGFGTEADCAALIAGIATNAGIGVSYSGSSPIVEIIARAGDGYTLPSQIPTPRAPYDDPLKKLFGGGASTYMLIGGVLLLVILLRD
jgi:hypothetical protein